jgi:hypothetical protein
MTTNAATIDVLRKLKLWLTECPTDQRHTLTRQQVEALCAQPIPDMAGTEPRLGFDERAKWFRAGRRSAFTSILGSISESSPDLVFTCPCENQNCSEAVHRDGRVKPAPEIAPLSVVEDEKENK